MIIRHFCVFLLLSTTVVFSAAGISTVRHNNHHFVTNEIIVKYAPAAGNVEAAGLGQKYPVLSAGPVFRTVKPVNTKNAAASLARIYKFKVQEGIDIIRLCEEMSADPMVEYAEPNYIFEAEAVPNDSLYFRQTHLPQIKSPEAWDVVKGSADVVIGVVGTGVDWDHPDLADAIWRNDDEVLDGTDTDGNGYIDDIRGWDFIDGAGSNLAPGEDGQVEDNDPMDFDGHETHCAGLAAAVTNNEIGVAGSSWGCTIMPVRSGYATADGRGSSVGDALSRGIVYAAENDADIINYSWTSAGQTIVEAARFAFENGSLVVNSAGNRDNDPDQDPLDPGSLGVLPYVLTVAAVTDEDKKTSYSSYGPWVTVSAPGGDPASGRPALLATFFDDIYAMLQGTSMAAPVAAGVAALVRSQHPEWSIGQVLFQVTETADDIYDLNPEHLGMLGTGRINAYRAVTETVTPDPDVVFEKIVVDDTLSGNANGLLDIGETANLVVTLQNNWGDAENLVATLEIDDPEVNIINGTSDFGTLYGLTNLPASRRSNKDQPFIVSVNENTVPHRINATLNLQADGGHQWRYNVSFSIDPKVLLIDDDGEYGIGGGVDVMQYYIDVLESIDVSFDLWDTGRQGYQYASILKKYDTVIWFCEKNTPTLDRNDRYNVQQFLEKYNGNLLIYGQDIGMDMCDAAVDSNQYFFSEGESREWYKNYLSARYVADNAFQYRIVPTDGDPIGKGLSFHFAQPDRDPGRQTPSRIDTLNGSMVCLQYADGSPAAVRNVRQTENGRFKTVYNAFGGIEAIRLPDMRHKLMAQSLNWLNDVEFAHEPLKDIATAQERVVSVNIDLQSDTLAVERADLIYTLNNEYPARVLEMGTEDGNVYTATLPAFESGRVDYKILIKTNTDYYLPRLPYSFTVGTDNEAPKISMIRNLKSTLNKTGPLPVLARVTDNTGVDDSKVFVHFWTGETDKDSVQLAPGAVPGEFTGDVTGDFMYGDRLVYYISARDAVEPSNLGETALDTITIGLEDFENGLSDWAQDSLGTWGLEKTGPYAGYFRLADSPGGVPASNTQTTLTLDAAIDLSGAQNALLSFWTQYALRFGRDKGYVEMSENNGESWVPLAQVAGKNNEWTNVQVPLNDYTGAGYENLQLRLRLETKAGEITEQFNGWFVDDIKIIENFDTFVSNNADKAPAAFTLLQNYPNPFNPVTTISYHLPKTVNVRIEIVNTLGQVIRTLVQRKQSAGRYQVIWDSRDQSGRPVASGLYFYRLEAGDFTRTRKLLLLK